MEDMSAAGVEEATGLTTVRLNNLHVQWPVWGHTMGHTAETMCGVDWFYTKGKVGGRCFTVRPCEHAAVSSGRSNC